MALNLKTFIYNFCTQNEVKGNIVMFRWAFSAHSLDYFVLTLWLLSSTGCFFVDLTHDPLDLICRLGIGIILV